MDAEKLKEVLANHALWLRGAGGSYADLSGANLSSADLRGANLRGANLRGAYLRDANLSGANLSGANLRGADLRGADLSSANLRGADLSSADLSSANLSGADLRSADLSSAIANEYTSGYWPVAPSVGVFTGWKKCRAGAIVELLIPADARRSSATSRKCRAEFVDVVRVYGGDEGVSMHDSGTVYCPGERVTCHEWDADRWNECSGGIHFFISREEAEAYN